jgi:hypothetical protein
VVDGSRIVRIVYWQWEIWIAKVSTFESWGFGMARGLCGDNQYTCTLCFRLSVYVRYLPDIMHATCVPEHSRDSHSALANRD